MAFRLIGIAPINQNERLRFVTDDQMSHFRIDQKQFRLDWHCGSIYPRLMLTLLEEPPGIALPIAVTVNRVPLVKAVTAPNNIENRVYISLFGAEKCKEIGEHGFYICGVHPFYVSFGEGSDREPPGMLPNDLTFYFKHRISEDGLGVLYYKHLN